MADIPSIPPDGGVSKVRPRLDAKPWGGHGLQRYGFELGAQENLGEAVVTAGDVEIESGFGVGLALAEVVGSDPSSALGGVALEAVYRQSVFPLLVKLIDARQNLSIQVHPGDAAAESPARLGKTEAWYILSAEPGARLYVGLRSGVTVEQFRKAAERRDGSSADFLRSLPATVGATILLPSGTVHALGAGVVVYEIQQPSDVTYRLDDWGRLDAEGRPREMHLDEGIASIRSDLRPEFITPVAVRSTVGCRHLLTMCDKFALERHAISGGGHSSFVVEESPQTITLLQGTAHVEGISLTAGESVVVWPGKGGIMLEAATPIVALRSWVPDIAAEVGSTTEARRYALERLSGLAGPLPDIALALERRPG